MSAFRSDLRGAGFGIWLAAGVIAFLGPLALGFLAMGLAAMTKELALPAPLSGLLGMIGVMGLFLFHVPTQGWVAILGLLAAAFVLARSNLAGWVTITLTGALMGAGYLIGTSSPWALIWRVMPEFLALGALVGLLLGVSLNGLTRLKTEADARKDPVA